MLIRDNTFAGCRILQRCGHGAYGTVYLAEDATGRRVALKVFDSPEAGERELRGIRNYMRIPEGTPSLVAIHHAGIEDGHFFYVMEAADNAGGASGQYIPDTLDRRLRLQPRLPLSEALAICQTLLDGLEAMHQAGILHRDIKPENILFFNGHPKLGDPGMAGDFTHTLSVAGTLGYIPPELFNASNPPRESADIYALGKVLYSMVTGKAPGEFPSLPPDLERDTMRQICLPLTRLCDADPALRCPDCAACRELLNEAACHHSWLMRQWRRLQLDRRWRSTVLYCIAALLLTAVFLAGWWLRPSAGASSGGAAAPPETAAPTEEQRKLQELEERLAQWHLRQEALSLQLQESGIALDLPARLSQLEELPLQEHPEELQAALDKLDAELARLAVAQQPQPPSPALSKPERFLLNAKEFGYLASPLGAWFLPEDARRELVARAEATAAEMEFFSPRVEVRNGSELFYQPQPAFHMKFVPPGSFLSPTTKRPETIDYPFWILETEVPFILFNFYQASRDRQSGQDTLPASQIAWNEMLAFCQTLTATLKKEIDLPAGYAIRLPTEAEWEYAALGGATGHLTPREALPPEKSVAAAHEGKPNPLGLLQMEGNLSEVVCGAYPALQPPPEFTIIRGASFQHGHSDIAFRSTMRLDQTTLDNIGFRFVFAPTPSNYLQDNWFHSNPLHTAQLHGKFYANLESCLAIYDWRNAQALATALGAHLPEPASRSEITEIFQTLHADIRYPAFFGIAFQEGAWRTLSNRHTSALAAAEALPLPEDDSPRLCLSGQPLYPCTPISADTLRPSLIMEWPSPMAYQERPQFPCSKSFEIDGRRFGLLEFKTSETLYSGFMELAGHQPPAPIPPETLRKVLEHLKDYPLSVTLGAWRFMDGWRWQDGTPATLPSPPEPGTLKPLQNLYNYSLVAQAGRLLYKSSANAVLVELPMENHGTGAQEGSPAPPNAP